MLEEKQILLVNNSCQSKLHLYLTTNSKCYVKYINFQVHLEGFKQYINVLECSWESEVKCNTVYSRQIISLIAN